mgnify:CR=1
MLKVFGVRTLDAWGEPISRNWYYFLLSVAYDGQTENGAVKRKVSGVAIVPQYRLMPDVESIFIIGTKRNLYQSLSARPPYIRNRE